MAQIANRTEFELVNWRHGQVGAERFAAATLVVLGYESVDPQSPLGGPDGKKDILCKKDGSEFVVGCYFPMGKVAFRDIKKKFAGDIPGVARNKAQGFAFFTNQYLNPGEVRELKSVAGPTPAILYHQENLLPLLNSPKGYGLRIAYLDIELTREEQIALVADKNEAVFQKLDEQHLLIKQIHDRMQTFGAFVVGQPPSSTISESVGANSLESVWGTKPTKNISVELLFWLHRIALEEYKLGYDGGRLRSISVWIGPPGSTMESAQFVPVPPEKVEAELKELLLKWTGEFDSCSLKDTKEILALIASFHHRFVQIHPFLDANGRVARMLLRQQVMDLLDMKIETAIDFPAEYYKALDLADKGDLAPLTKFLEGKLVL